MLSHWDVGLICLVPGKFEIVRLQFRNDIIEEKLTRSSSVLREQLRNVPFLAPQQHARTPDILTDGTRASEAEHNAKASAKPAFLGNSSPCLQRRTPKETPEVEGT